MNKYLVSPLVSKDGTIKGVRMPKPENYPQGHNLEKYQAALQLAQENALSFENQEEAKARLIDYVNKGKPTELMYRDGLYPSISWEVFEVEQFKHKLPETEYYAGWKDKLSDLQKDKTYLEWRTILRFSDVKEEPSQPVAQNEKQVNYFLVPIPVTCPFESCGYTGNDTEFELTWKGPDTIRICPKCGNSHVIATTTTSSVPDTRDELIKDLWTLWEDMAECGELKIGPKFKANYERLKKKVYGE